MTSSQKQFDVAVVGAGVIGCSIAWRLGQAGLRVVVVERGPVGREASYAAGGMLAPLAEADRADEFFELAVASRALYVGFAEELRATTGIDIEYRTEGTLYLVLCEEDEAELEHRWQWQHKAGLNIQRLSADEVLSLEPQVNRRVRWALKFPDDHQVENRKLMLAVELAARNVGVELWPYTEVQSVITQGNASQPATRQAVGLQTTRGELRARKVVIAAGSWTDLLLKNQHVSHAEFSVEPVRGQMIALEMPMPKLNHVIYSTRGYVIPRLSGVVIAGSTTERVGYDKRVTAGGIASIIERAAEIAPSLSNCALVETWSGLRPASSDEWPILGESASINGLIYATGHYRNGILLTPITAQSISEIILHGESCTNLAAFSPARFERSHSA